MKVKELIEILQKCNPEKEIVCYDADNKKANLVNIVGVKDKHNEIEIKTEKSI